MPTVFSIPKPFEGAAATAQWNALRSWRALGDDVELLLFGDESGVAQAARSLGARHEPRIKRTTYGTPLVSEAFARAAELVTGDVIVYANADIIFLRDILSAVEHVSRLRALAVGRRVDVTVDRELDFTGPWEQELRVLAGRGEHGTERQIDYMVFPRDVPWQMPPFAVGRPGWDNWVLYRARRLGLPILDATEVVLAVHQSHAYEHVPHRRGERWRGPEWEAHKPHLREMGFAYGINDATHVLTAAGVHRALGLRHLKRRVLRLKPVGALVARVRA